MSETSASLLERLSDQPESADWDRLVTVYTPLIRGWIGHQAALQGHDADDVVQEVLAVLVRKLSDFRREPRTGAFRRWLKSITINCLRDFWKTRRNRSLAHGGDDLAAVLEQLEDPHSGLSQLWDDDYEQFVTRKLLELIRPAFSASTWAAFQGFAMEGRSADDVARELGITVNAVFIAKSRVLTRLRQEGKGLLDDE